MSVITPHDQEKKLVVVLPQHPGEFFIRAWVSDYWMDFECVKCVSWVEDGSLGWSATDVPLYEPKDELKEKGGGSPPTEDPNEGFVHMHGFLKWDGCMEVEREDYHYCCAAHIEQEYRCIQRIRQLAAAKMGHWESDIPRHLCPRESHE